jgi:hypothetical protein
VSRLAKLECEGCRGVLAPLSLGLAEAPSLWVRLRTSGTLWFSDVPPVAMQGERVGEAAFECEACHRTYRTVASGPYGIPDAASGL